MYYVVYGPAGSGKTKNATKIADVLGCSQIYDQWQGGQGALLEWEDKPVHRSEDKHLILTNLPPEKWSAQFDVYHATLSIEDALYMLKFDNWVNPEDNNGILKDQKRVDVQLLRANVLTVYRDVPVGIVGDWGYVRAYRPRDQVVESGMLDKIRYSWLRRNLFCLTLRTNLRGGEVNIIDLDVYDSGRKYQLNPDSVDAAIDRAIDATEPDNAGYPDDEDS